MINSFLRKRQEYNNHYILYKYILYIDNGVKVVTFSSKFKQSTIVQPFNVNLHNYGTTDVKFWYGYNFGNVPTIIHYMIIIQ